MPPSAAFQLVSTLTRKELDRLVSILVHRQKSAHYSNLDWTKVDANDVFSAKAAEKVDWTQVSAFSLDLADIAKLRHDAFSGKNKKLSAWLHANTTSTTGSGSGNGLSFAGIAQPQAAGDFTTGQESGGSVGVLLAAVEKPLLSA